MSRKLLSISVAVVSIFCIACREEIATLKSEWIEREFDYEEASYVLEEVMRWKYKNPIVHDINGDENPDWISVSYNADQVIINLSENSSLYVREALIRFPYIENDAYTLTIDIRQGGKDQVYLHLGTSYRIGKNGGEIKIPIFSNVDCDCYVDSKSSAWISIAQTKSLSNPYSQDITINVSENIYYDERVGTVIISYNGGEKKELMISQSQKDELFIGRNSFEIGSDANEEIIIPILTNTNYQAELLGESSAWLSIKTLRSKGLEDCCLTLSATENLSIDERIGQIKVYSADQESVITILQKASDGIILNQSSYQISEQGGIVEIPFMAGSPFTVAVSGAASSWLSIVPTESKALTSQTIKVKVERNTSIFERSGQVDIICMGKNSIVSINQNSADGIVVEGIWEVSPDEQDLNIDYQTNVVVSCEVESSARDWISHIQTKAVVDGTSTLHIAQNTTDAERSAKVRLFSDGYEKEITVKQGFIGGEVRSYSNSDGEFLVDNVLKYKLESGCLSVCGLSPEFSPNTFSGEITVPKYINYDGKSYLVRSIGDKAFEDIVLLKSIRLPDSIEWIGSWAFSNCTKLTAINLPDALKQINRSAFAGCVSEGLNFNVPLCCTIGLDAFRGCTGEIDINGNFGLALCNSCFDKVFLGESVTEIQQGAFAGSGIKNIFLPQNTTQIQARTFENCTELISIYMPDCIQTIDAFAFAGCVSLKGINLSDNIQYIGDHAFNGCASLTNIYIPKLLTEIPESAFDGCSNLKQEVILPDGIISIGRRAFCDCSNISRVSMSAGVTQISESAFEGCSNLESINLPNSITIIASSTFKNCSRLDVVNIPQGVSTIEEDAFSGCSGMTHITIPESVLEMTCPFRGCTGEAIINCKIQGPPLPDPGGIHSEFPGYKHYFTDAAFDKVILGNTITEVGLESFMDSKIKSIVIPGSVSLIKGAAFYNCTELRSVEIRGMLRSIGAEAFYNCCALTDINLPSGLLSIGGYAFYQCRMLTNFSIPESVTYIGEYAFYRCKHLGEIIIPSGVSKILSGTFKASNISIEIPNTITFIGAQAFGSCEGYISLPNSAQHIRFESITVFDGCRAEVTIDYDISGANYPDGITNPYTYNKPDNAASAFYGNRFPKVTFGPNVTSIGNYAFYGCIDLTDITIPQGVTSIGSAAFNGCTGLTDVKLPEGVTSIGSSAFEGCDKLASVFIPSTVTEIGADAFTMGLYSVSRSIYCAPETPPTLADKDCFGSAKTYCLSLYVPRESLELYKTAPYWNAYLSCLKEYDF